MSRDEDGETPATVAPQPTMQASAFTLVLDHRHALSR